MKHLPIAVAMMIAGWLAWQAWQPPLSPPAQISVKGALPEKVDAGPEMWRIVTKRMVWKKAIAAMRDRLYKEGFETQLIVKQEPIELHAFDDPGVFKTQAEAEKVKKVWRKKKIEAEVLKREITYIVGLGRFFLTSYAEQMQERLKRIGKPYKYERRTVTIPAYRFVFNPMEKAEATKSWQKLQNLGIAEPVMMRESEFQKLYGKKPA
ncbi:MAG TPA: hypothetical protein VKA23_04665 [Mariprofundaceae bacterium]|nr:hypothetical protein [Mariprofundaceae bacterium]